MPSGGLEMQEIIKEMAPYATVVSGGVAAIGFVLTRKSLAEWIKYLRERKGRLLLLTIKSNGRQVGGLWLRFLDTGLINPLPSGNNGDMIVDNYYKGRSVSVEVLESDQRKCVATAILDFTNGKRYVVIHI